MNNATKVPKNQQLIVLQFLEYYGSRCGIMEKQLTFAAGIGIKSSLTIGPDVKTLENHF